MAYDERFIAYSCGGSRGIGEISPHRIPFLIPKGTVDVDGRILSGSESISMLRQVKRGAFLAKLAFALTILGHVIARRDGPSNVTRLFSETQR